MESVYFALEQALPEAILACGVLALLMIGSFAGERSARRVMEGALVVLIAALLVIVLSKPQDGNIFDNSFINDAFSRYIKILMLLSACFALAMSGDFLRRHQIYKFEYPILAILATLGMMMLVSANNLLALYLGLELMSLSLYILAAFQRDNVRASEAGVKYFVLGALSSGMLLYGCSLIYGYAGSIAFPDIAKAVANGPQLGVIFGLVFLLAGLAFKMSAAPFHMWTPDVYQGAPTPVAAFMATGPKVAAVAVTMRVAFEAFPGLSLDWRQIIVFLSLLSIVIGSFGAIGQKNIKRFAAYSSIANIGFALVGLATGAQSGAQGTIFYMTVYVVMTLGLFGAILAMRVSGRDVVAIADLSGLAQTNPALAFCWGVLMFSYAGIPPLLGFFAKYYVFLAAVQADMTLFALIAGLLSVVAAFYYLRIVKLMYFDPPSVTLEPSPLPVRFTIAFSAALLLFGVIFLNPLLKSVSVAAQALL